MLESLAMVHGLSEVLVKPSSNIATYGNLLIFSALQFL